MGLLTVGTDANCTPAWVGLLAPDCPGPVRHVEAAGRHRHQPEPGSGLSLNWEPGRTDQRGPLRAPPAGAPERTLPAVDPRAVRSRAMHAAHPVGHVQAVPCFGTWCPCRGELGGPTVYSPRLLQALASGGMASTGQSGLVTTARVK